MSTSLSPSSSLDMLSHASFSTRWASDSLSDDEDEIVWSLSSSAVLSPPPVLNDSSPSPLSEVADYVLVPRINARSATPPLATPTTAHREAAAPSSPSPTSTSESHDEASAIAEGMAALSLSGATADSPAASVSVSASASASRAAPLAPPPIKTKKKSKKNGRAGSQKGVAMPPPPPPPVDSGLRPSGGVPAAASPSKGKKAKKTRTRSRSRSSSSSSSHSESSSSRSGLPGGQSESRRSEPAALPPSASVSDKSDGGGGSSSSSAVPTPKRRPRKSGASGGSPGPTSAPAADVAANANADSEGKKEPISTAYHEAHKFMNTYLAHPPPPGNNGSALLMLQALILELGCLPSAAAAGKFSIPELPGTMRQAKLLLKSHAFINVRDYLAVREQGQAALQQVMHPSRKSLVREVRKGKRVPVQQVKKVGLNVLLVNTRL